MLVGAPALGVQVLQDYQKDRLTSFLEPSADPADAGYQQQQSKIAIGSGEKTGRGVEDATQTQLDYLPEHHTDFIFAVVGETYGFVGCALVLSLYALLIWRALHILTIAKNLYGALLAGGITVMLLFQLFVNVGMNVGIMPITGVTAPLLSARRLLDARHLPGHRPPPVDQRASARDRCGQGPGHHLRMRYSREEASARDRRPGRDPGRDAGGGRGGHRRP